MAMRMLDYIVLWPILNIVFLAKTGEKVAVRAILNDEPEE